MVLLPNPFLLTEPNPRLLRLTLCEFPIHRVSKNLSVFPLHFVGNLEGALAIDGGVNFAVSVVLVLFLWWAYRVVDDGKPYLFVITLCKLGRYITNSELRHLMR
jgi:hypothetical protein